MDIKMIGDFLTKIKRVGTGLGVHMPDTDLTAFIQTRRQTPLARAHKKDNFFIEEDVTKISNLGLENLGHIFRERLFMQDLVHQWIMIVQSVSSVYNKVNVRKFVMLFFVDYNVYVYVTITKNIISFLKINMIFDIHYKINLYQNSTF